MLITLFYLLQLLYVVGPVKISLAIKFNFKETALQDFITGSKKMNLDSYDQPNILFLRGCFLSDCKSIEDMFDARVMDEAMPEGKLYESKEIEYDTLAKKFTTLEAWASTTNLKCWTCDCNFYTIPIFVPNNIERAKDSTKLCGSMDVIGNFCSWNCASHHINIYFTGSKRWEKHEFLKVLYKIFTGGVITEDIAPSPPKTNMVQYGGSQTLEEYRAGIYEMSSKYAMSIQSSSMDKIRFQSAPSPPLIDHPTEYLHKRISSIV